MNQVIVTQARGLNYGGKQLLENIYKDIQVYKNIPYAKVVTFEDEVKLYSIEKEEFLELNFRTMEPLIYNYPRLAKQDNIFAIKSNENLWGLFDAKAGKLLEEMTHLCQPLPTNDHEIFILSDDSINGKVYFKNVYKKTNVCDDLFFYADPYKGFLWKVGEEEYNISVLNIKENRYAVKDEFIINIHEDSPYAIVKKRNETEFRLIKTYSQRVVRTGKTMEFDYTDRNPAVIIDGGRYDLNE